MKKIFLFLCIIGFPQFIWAGDYQHVASYLKGLNRTRESLAQTLDHSDAPITAQTFKEVCVPVGKSFKEWGAKNGYLVKQIAQKYRNPDHQPSESEQKIFKIFNQDKQKQSYIVSGKSQDGMTGTYVYGRIPVAKSCLHCHGSKNSRPDFIKIKYPQDKAFGFKVGDLRGLYSVFIRE